jgi:glutathione S-transferase
LDALPHVDEWHASIAARAGYRKWIATSDEELRVTG